LYDIWLSFAIFGSIAYIIDTFWALCYYILAII
jgi:hypothetical protein